MAKNAVLIGSSLLGSWSAEVNLASDDGSSLTAYSMVYLMADPRKGLGCNLPDCREVDNKVCMIAATDDIGHFQKACHDIAEENDVSWSDCKYL
jgi:hypothetical protein